MNIADRIIGGCFLSVLVAIVVMLIVGTYFMAKSELRKQEAFDSCQAVKPLHECYTNIILVN